MMPPSSAAGIIAACVVGQFWVAAWLGAQSPSAPGSSLDETRQIEDIVLSGQDAHPGMTRHVPSGLDLYMPLPEDNALTRETIELGRRLFHDRRLSRDGSRSCTSCNPAAPCRAASRGPSACLDERAAATPRP